MTYGKYKPSREIGVYKELINDVKLINFIAMGDCATRNQARIKLGLTTVGGGNEYITKQEALDLGADLAPLNKYIGPKELVSIDDILSGAYKGVKWLTLYNFDVVATRNFQTIVDFALSDDQGLILNDSIEISRSVIDPTESDATTQEVLNIPKGRELTNASLEITSIKVYNNNNLLDLILPKLYIAGNEGPVAELDNIDTSLNKPLIFDFPHAGDQRRVGFEIDFKSYVVMGQATLNVYDIEEMAMDNLNIDVRLLVTLNLVNEQADAFKKDFEIYLGYEKPTGEQFYNSVIEFSVPTEFDNATGTIEIDNIYISTGGSPLDIPIRYMTISAENVEIYSAMDVWQGEQLGIKGSMNYKGSFKLLNINLQF